MEKNNFHVTVRSYAENLDDFGLTESTESDTLTVDANLAAENGKITLSYKQKSEGGECKTNLTVKDKTVTLTRSGAIESVMIFSEGKTTETLYSIPPYSFDASIETKRIKSSLCSTGGTLELLYFITVGGAKKKMRLSLTVY